VLQLKAGLHFTESLGDWNDLDFWSCFLNVSIVAFVSLGALITPVPTAEKWNEYVA
jgi:hypothetical protein